MASGREDFTGGTPGNNIPTNGSFGIIAGGANGASSTFNFANDWAVTGTVSGKVVCTASTQRYLALGSLVSTCHMTTMFTYDANDTANNAIMQVRSTTTVRAQVQIVNGGALRLTNATTQVGVASTALTNGVKYRIDWHIIGNTSQSADVYSNATGNLHGTVPDFSIASTTYNSGTFDRYYVGFANAPTGSRTAWFDSVAFDTAASIGSPFKSGTGTGSFTVVGTSAGNKTGLGSGTGSFTLGASSAGTKAGLGTGTASFTTGASSAGFKTGLGTSSSAFTVTEDADGFKTGIGEGDGSFTLTSESEGQGEGSAPTPEAPPVGGDGPVRRRPARATPKPQRLTYRAGTGTGQFVTLGTASGFKAARGVASTTLPPLVADSTGSGNQAERRRAQELELLTL